MGVHMFLAKKDIKYHGYIYISFIYLNIMYINTTVKEMYACKKFHMHTNHRLNASWDGGEGRKARHGGTTETGDVIGQGH